MERLINFYVLVNVPSTLKHKTYCIRSFDKASVLFRVVNTYKIPEVSVINIVEAPIDIQGDIFFESKNHKP